MPGSYWNEEIETLSRDGVARLESERLQAQMSYLYANSDYFRARFDQAGIKPKTITNRSDLAAIPFMEFRGQYTYLEFDGLRPARLGAGNRYTVP